MCDKCFGTGLIDGPNPKVCKVCGGTGEVSETKEVVKEVIVEDEVAEVANEPAPKEVVKDKPKKRGFFRK